MRNGDTLPEDVAEAAARPLWAPRGPVRDEGDLSPAGVARTVPGTTATVVDDELDPVTAQIVPLQGTAPATSGPLARPPSAEPPDRAAPTPRWVWLLLGGVAAAALAALAVVLMSRGAAATSPSESVPSTTAPASVPAPVAPRAAIPSTPLVSVTAGASAGADDPALPAIVGLLDQHFGAINSRDYTTWTTTVTPRRAAPLPRGTWLTNYASTRDGSVTIEGVRSSAGSERLVELSFVSTQDPADAPTDLPVGRICWSSTWPVVSSDGRLVLDVPPRGSTTKRGC